MITIRSARFPALTFAALLAVIAALPASAQDWPRFRGPDGAGVGGAANVPAAFTDKDVAWRINLPGVGHSSPVLWGDKIFVTCAEEDLNSNTGVVRRLVCVNAADGKILWNREHASRTYRRHGDNSYATPSCTADVRHVYVCWNLPEELTVEAYTHDGAPVWSRKLGPYATQHGGGASPVAFEDVVVMPNDQDGAGFLVALDALTGQDRWRVPRRAGEFSASSPCVFRDAGGAAQLVFTAKEHGMTGVDPKTGKVLWEVPKAFDSRTVGSPAAGAGLVFASCGQGPGGHLINAVRPGVNGKPAEVAYKLTENTPYVPSPLVVGDLLIYWSDTGTVTCTDAATGQKRWQERVGGACYASPVAAGGRVFNVSKAGEVIAFAASGEGYKELGRSRLPMDKKDKVHATPAVAGGRIYFRTFRQLMCVGGGN
jgi:outer membrane protein assembly factor BamB